MSLPRRVLAALALVTGFLFLHLLGARDDVAVLSGTATANGASSALLGVLYVLAWFGAVVAAPVLALGALLDRALAYLTGQRRATKGTVGSSARPRAPSGE